METNAKKLTYWQQHFKRCKARKLAKIRGPLPYMWQGSGSKSGSQKRVRAPLKIQLSSQYFVAHKKCSLTYQTYAAVTFFARASSCLEL